MTGEVGVRRLSPGHLHTPLAGGAGHRTGTLPVISQHALPPELLPAAIFLRVQFPSGPMNQARVATVATEKPPNPFKVTGC